MKTTHAPFSSTSRIALVLAGSLAVAGVGACSDDGDANEPAMTAGDYDEVATTMGALVADENRGEPNAYGGAVLLARGVVPTDFQISGGIAIGELLGFDYSFTVACRDGAGSEVTCGDDAAASAHIVVAWAGDWNSGDVVASSDFDGDWSLSGLDQDLIVLDGSADASASLTRTTGTGGERSWRVDYRATYNDVAIDADSRKAVSGSVSYDVQIDRSYSARTDDVERHFSVDADVSFQADGTATLVLDGDQVYRMRRNGSVELVARGALE